LAIARAWAELAWLVAAPGSQMLDEEIEYSHNRSSGIGTGQNQRYIQMGEEPSGERGIGRPLRDWNHVLQ